MSKPSALRFVAPNLVCCGSGCTREIDSDCRVSSTCDQCEMSPHAGSTLCPDYLRRCDDLRGITSANSPVSPGVPRAELCRAILDCTHETQCAAQAASDCLCGMGVDPNVCFNGTFEAMHGPVQDSDGCRLGNQRRNGDGNSLQLRGLREWSCGRGDRVVRPTVL